MNRTIPREVLDLIPAHYADRHKIVPLALASGVLTVAHPPALAAGTLRELSVLLGVEVRGEEAEPAELSDLLKVHYGLGASAIESLVRQNHSSRSAGNGASSAHTLEISEAADDAAIVAFVNRLINQALEDDATDIHIEPYEEKLRVRCRIDGFLQDVPIPSEAFRFHASIVSRLKVMAHLDIAEHRLPQDGRFRTRVRGEELDFRVSVLPTPYGESVDLRVLGNSSILRGLESLGLQKDDVRIVEEILTKPHGVVLVTGPTGSGKTTTLYSFLAALNQIDRKIITIEDPIEYKLEGITQIQVLPRIGLDFARGLRSMLRHDPDVMMVGEIRDRETAETVIRVALTGHLVFSTIHTNDAASTPARLMDMGEEPYLVASSVECVIAQRLVRLLCRDCSEPLRERVTARALGVRDEGLSRILDTEEPDFRTAKGCSRCRNTGYRGRTAIFEMMPLTPRIRERILQRDSATGIGDVARKQGFWPLRWKGLQVAARGITSIEEVLRVSAADEL